MNNKIVSIIILIIVLFLTGCNNETQTISKEISYIGGTEGLKTSFLSENPPYNIADGASGVFSIIIKAENVGESTIAASDGYVQISGIDAKTYNYPDKTFKKIFSEQDGFGTEIKSIKKNINGLVLNGGVATIEFANLQYMPIIREDSPQQTIWADVCYKYKTKVATEICVKNNYKKTTSETQICEVEGEKTLQNSGAPIHVTTLNESYIGNNKVGITLTLTHVGNGDGFFKDDKLSCNNVASNIDSGKVHIQFDNVKIAGKDVPVVCTEMESSGYVKLVEDTSGKETYKLYCTIDVSNAKNIEKIPLNLEMSYVYLQHVESNFIIRHVAK